ncbi:MAG TPA: ATP-binding protein [Chthoniobacteraceae bacterium]|nr:ATP-binding protein [Chthoniobacteraceae bacterium]
MTAPTKDWSTPPPSTVSRREDGAAALLFEHAPTGLARISREGHWVTVNQWLCRFLGYSARELEGKRWSSHSHPDDFAANWLACSDLFEGKLGCITVEHRLRRSDDLMIATTLQITTLPASGEGERPSLLLSVQPALPALGAAPACSSAGRLAKRQLRDQPLPWKEHYESILLATGQVVYEVDPARDAVAFTGDLQNLTGYSPAQIGESWSAWLEKIHPDDRPLLQQLGSAATPGESYHLEYRLMAPDGRVVSLRDDGSIVTVGAKGRSRRVGVLVDISEQRGLAMQLHHAQKMEVFGRLAGGIAHDFNNLLTVFSGYTELLISEFSEADPHREYLDEMRRATERAAALTSQLLAFGRLQRSAPREVDLGELLMELQKMLRRLIGEDVELVMRIGDDLGSVYADPRQLETVLINLVVNARDAMPHGGRLSIEAVNTVLRAERPRSNTVGLKPGAYVVLCVSDTGIGIDAKLFGHIFEPFFTTKPPGEGTGLGLSTCYGIVEQCGGRMTVESTPGKGSAFRIYLPRSKSGSPGRPVGPSKRPARLPRGNGETILLVEDDLAVQKIYGTILRRLGYTVICGSNGDEALRIAGQHPEIRLVITDVVMPLMSGTDLAEELRHLLPKTKIVLTSGYAPESVESAVSSRQTPFLPKPLTRDILASTLRDLLENQ